MITTLILLTLIAISSRFTLNHLTKIQTQDPDIIASEAQLKAVLENKNKSILNSYLYARNFGGLLTVICGYLLSILVGMKYGWIPFGISLLLLFVCSKAVQFAIMNWMGSSMACKIAQWKFPLDWILALTTISLLISYYLG